MSNPQYSKNGIDWEPAAQFFKAHDAYIEAKAELNATRRELDEANTKYGELRELLTLPAPDAFARLLALRATNSQTTLGNEAAS